MSDSDDFNYDPNDNSYPKTSPPKKHGSSNCNLPENKTVLSLNKGEIVQLPGFKSLRNYLLTELKGFVRVRVHQYTKKKRGYKVKEYVEKYRSNPEPYIPSHPTKRKMIAPPKSNTSNDSSTPPANYMSKKQRKAALISAAQNSKAAARKQRRKENKAKRVAIKQANWEKHVAEKEEAIAREALIRESNARSKIFKDIKNNGKLAQSAKQIARTKRNLELIHDKPVRIISIEDNK